MGIFTNTMSEVKLDDEEVLDTQVESVIQPEKIEIPKRTPSTINEKLALNVLFTERKPPPKPPVVVAPQKRVLSPELQAAKAELKKLLQEAWSEFE